MPFMIGSAPVRRTLKYLKDCKIIFRENVRIFSLSYDRKLKHHSGAKDFAFWHLAQIQFNNPTVHCITLGDITPSPFIKIYLEDDKSFLIDLESRSREEIYDHLASLRALTKTEAELKQENALAQSKINTSQFGFGCPRHCMCEVFGQVPCSSVVPVPKHWRGIPDKNPKLKIPYYLRKWGQENRNAVE